MHDFNPRILILGGSGFIGRSLCEQLLRQLRGRARITVPTRRLSHAQAIQGLPGLTVVQADVHDSARLQSLVEGQDIVINLVAILQGSEAQFERAHVQLPTRLAQACTAADVRRLIHVSALGVQEGSGDAPSRYLRSKTRGEAALQSAGLELTLLRPSVVFGAADHFVNLFAKLQALFPVMPLAGAGVRFQPVWVEDVARALVACVLDKTTIGQVYELAGPEVLSLGEIVRMAGRYSGHARPVLPLPSPLAWAQAVMMEMMPGEPLMSRDNLASMKVPNVASGRLPDLATLGIQSQSMSAVLPTYLGVTEGCARLDSLRRRSGR